MKNSCQSCAMPLKKDNREGKSDLDDRYCSLCFSSGDFTAKNTSAKEFQAEVYRVLREQGWWRPMAWLATRMIPSLPRWKQSDPDTH